MTKKENPVEAILSSLNATGSFSQPVVSDRVILDFTELKATGESGTKWVFNGVKFKESFAIQSLISPNVEQIDFIKCVFLGDFKFQSTTNKKLKVHFDDCQFSSTKGAVFDEDHLEQLEFKNSLLSRLSLSESSIKTVSCSNTVVDHFSVSNSKISNLEIENLGTEKIRSLDTTDSEIDTIKLSLSSVLNELKLGEVHTAAISAHIDWVTIDSSNFSRILFERVEDRNPDERTPAKIKRFVFENKKFEGDLVIENLEIEDFKLDNITSSKGSIQLTETTLTDVSIRRCYFSKFYWIQLEFVNPPEIIQSDLSGLKMSNVTWPKDRRLKGSMLGTKIPLFYLLRKKKIFEPNEISELKHHIDTYRQLKFASIKNYDQMDALLFYKNEMQLYWKYVRVSGGVKWHDRVLVFLNRWVSNFGQSWHMPLIWLFTVHFLLILSLSGWDLNTDWEAFRMGVGQFFESLNPAHRKLIWIGDGYGLFVDFLMRISGGFFIYHFVKASRKFGKML